MGKAKQNNKKKEAKRRQMIQEVFKKGKKQREIAKKFDEKIAQKQGIKKNREKFQVMKQQKVSSLNLIRHLNLPCQCPF